MYNAYFGFREKPFNVTPDPRFLFENVSYQEAYANLFYGIRERKGFIVLTGEVGTGKTTLLRRLMDSLEDTLRFVFFYNTTLSFEELLDHIFVELRLNHQSGDGRFKKIQALNHFLISQLEQGGTVALLIDEAQNLSDETLENLRLLSNLETAQEKLLQIVLVGQPELETKLSQPHLRQLKQRIVTWSKLSHLRDNEIGPFLIHRLRIAGYGGPPLFTEEAVQRIALYSKGIPRLINVICDNALLIAYAASRRTVSAAVIEEAAHDLQLLSVSRKVRPTTLLGNDTQLTEPSSHLQEQARPHPQTPTRKAKEPSPLPNSVQAAIAQEPSATSWAPHSPSLDQGIRLGISLILLLTTGVAVFGLMFSSTAGVFPESKTAAFTDRIVSLAQTLNSALSVFLVQTMGLEAHENLPAPQIAALQKNPQERLEASEGGFIPPLSDTEKKELEGVEPLEKAPESDSNNIPEAAVLSAAIAADSHDQSSDLFVDTKAPSEVGGQQDLVALTPSVAPLQDLHQVKEQTIRLQPGATILSLVREVYGSQNTLALALIKEFNPRINDLDHVTAGTTIFVPSFSEETLLRKQPDGSYRLLTAVFLRAALAQKHADMVRQHEYSVEVFPAQVAGSLLLYRVEIVGLPNREAGQHAWTFVDVHNVLTVAAQPSENEKRTE